MFFICFCLCSFVPKLGEVQPKHAGETGELGSKTFPKAATRVNNKTIPIRPPPPPPLYLLRRRPGTRSAPSRPSNGPRGRPGDEGRSLPRRSGDLGGIPSSQDSFSLSPRDGSTRMRATTRLPTNEMQSNDEEALALALSPSRALRVLSSLLWMEHSARRAALSLSSEPMLVYLFLLPGRLSLIAHPSHLSSINPLRLLSLSSGPSPRNNAAQQLAPLPPLPAAQ